MKFFLLLFIFSFSAFGLKEQDYSLVYKLLDDSRFYEMGEFEGQNNRTLKYARFGKAKGIHGPLIFINGKGENLFKYIELFYDLNQQGWSPVYTYDHRGQGFSRNLKSKKHWGGVEDYSYYREDLKSFLSLVKKQQPQKAFFVIAHSMGALIVVDYLQNYDHSDWKALVLSSPMFGIQTGLVGSFYYFSSIYCSLTSCLKKNSSKPNPWSVLSYSRAREGFFRYLQKERFPQTDVVVPPASWVYKSKRTYYSALKPENIKKIQVPLLIFQAKKDTVVQNHRHKKFCQVIPKNCELKLFDGKHGLFLEKDKTRNAVIQKTLLFFKKHKSPHKNL